MTTLVLVFSLLLLALAGLPLIKTGAWWIRGLDFPRFQLFSLSLLFLGIQLYLYSGTTVHLVSLVSIAIAIALDAYRIWPYSPFAPKQTPSTPADSDRPMIRFLSANVRQKNRNFALLEEQIKKNDPDIIVLVETNGWWTKESQVFKKSYPYFVEQPQENTYGILVYSKFPIKDSEIKFLVDDKVPSIFTQLEVFDGCVMDLICLHPRPPRPQEGPSDQRDGELMQVAQFISKKESDNPTVVLGDFNDVAWSHTTRLFKRVSGCLDPRVGRGPCATFPVMLPLLRFPLDHVFHSPNFTLDLLKRLPTIGSDHFPLLLELRFLGEDVAGSAENSAPDDEQEAQKLKKRGDEWDGPNNEVE